MGDTEAVEERLARPGFKSHLCIRPRDLPWGGEDHVRFHLTVCAGEKGGKCVEGLQDAERTLIIMAVGVIPVLERWFGTSAALEQVGSPPQGRATLPYDGAFLGCESSAQSHQFTSHPTPLSSSAAELWANYRSEIITRGSRFHTV